LTLVCTKSFVGWGFAQTPCNGELAALPRPSSWVEGTLFLRVREGKVKDGRGTFKKYLKNVKNVKNVTKIKKKR